MSRPIKFRAYKKENVTGTYIEAKWLFRLACFQLLVAIGLRQFIKIHNREARQLVKWRRSFYA